MKNSVSESYDKVAAEYSAHIADELAGKPLDRALLQAFAEQVGTERLVYDIGCGPGHVAAFLAQAGANVEGIDVSNGMVEQASLRYPNLRFSQGDMRSFAAADHSLGGIVAFYSIIHIEPAELASTFREWNRALCPSGLVLVAFHIGDHVVHLDDWWNHAVDLDFRFLPVEAVVAALHEAGFTIEATLRRAPYAGAEHPSERAYILACKTNAAVQQVSQAG